MGQNRKANTEGNRNLNSDLPLPHAMGWGADPSSHRAPHSSAQLPPATTRCLSPPPPARLSCDHPLSLSTPTSPPLLRPPVPGAARRVVLVAWMVGEKGAGCTGKDRRRRPASRGSSCGLTRQPRRFRRRYRGNARRRRRSLGSVNPPDYCSEEDRRRLLSGGVPSLAGGGRDPRDLRPPGRRPVAIQPPHPLPLRKHQRLNYNIYLSSLEGDKSQDEIDFEFLGKDNTIVQTNFYTGGVGGREVIRPLGFDASEDFHEYLMRWDADEIVWLVHGDVILLEVRGEGQPWPEKPMLLYDSLWDASYIDDGRWTGQYVSSDAPYVCKYKDVQVPIESIVIEEEAAEAGK